MHPNNTKSRENSTRITQARKRPKYVDKNMLYIQQTPFKRSNYILSLEHKKYLHRQVTHQIISTDKPKPFSLSKQVFTEPAHERDVCASWSK